VCCKCLEIVRNMNSDSVAKQHDMRVDAKNQVSAHLRAQCPVRGLSAIPTLTLKPGFRENGQGRQRVEHQSTSGNQDADTSSA
jgi:hypothetical protein